jgi:hypothetical protein
MNSAVERAPLNSLKSHLNYDLMRCGTLQFTTYVPNYTASIPKDSNLNIRCRENLKFEPKNRSMKLSVPAGEVWKGLIFCHQIQREIEHWSINFSLCTGFRWNKLGCRPSCTLCFCVTNLFPSEVTGFTNRDIFGRPCSFYIFRSWRSSLRGIWCFQQDEGKTLYAK